MNLPFHITFEHLDQYMNQQEKLPTVSIFAGPTHSPIDQCISRSKHGFARLDQRLRQPDVNRRQHKYLLVFQLQILGVCKGYIRKMAERYYLPLSLCVFLRLSSPICHNPDLLHRRLSGGLLISIRPSSWFVLIRSFGAFGFLGLYTSCMFLMRLIVSVQECWFDKHKLIHCLQRVTNESLVSSGTPFRICNSNVDNSNCPIAFGVVSPG